MLTMTRKRGRPRRGSAWYTHKEQRRRRKNLERALSMAISILRQRARADQLALHAIIAGPGTKRSIHTMAIEPRSSLEGGTADEFPTCYVDETSYLEDLATNQLSPSHGAGYTGW
jgi:riboflavin biosynthesis pyrimidine reductase